MDTAALLRALEAARRRAELAAELEGAPEPVRAYDLGRAEGLRRAIEELEELERPRPHLRLA